jgi:hypothetical protein
VNLKPVALYFDVKNAACGLPVDGFVADWAVNEECTVLFYYEQTFAGFKCGTCPASITYSAVPSNDEGASLSECSLD